MQKIIVILAGLFSFFYVKAQSADTAKADAKITAATVYFGYGAELYHQARVKLTPGTRYIVIDRLSTSVDVNSLQISSPEDIALLSHRFQVFYPEKKAAVKNKDIEKWEDSLAMLDKKAGQLRNLIVIEQETMTKTGTLIEAALNGGTKTVTSVEVLKLVDYYTTKIERSKTAIYKHNLVIEEVAGERKKVQDKLKDLRAAEPPHQPFGRLILQVMSKRSADIPLSLSYYTHSAGWTPVYDIRVNSRTNKIKLVYKASLTQRTGIDWKETKLTLSTGTPNFGVAAPLLSPWYLQLYVPEIYNMLQGRAAGINATRNRIQSFSDDNALEEVVITGYGIAKEEKEYDTSIVTKTLQDFTTLSTGQLNTNFEIDLPYDISSDGQLHSVSIKDEEINAVLKNYAIPRVDKEAYLLAEVADWQNLDLLPGDANIIMDDTYIGKSIIDPHTAADTLNLSLGKDKRVVVSRSVVKELSSLKASGGSNKQTFTYEVIVKNNKLTDVNLLLKDQYPLSTIKEIEVKMEDSGDAMVNEETGVLTWKMALKPGESKKIRFTYSVKYPKNKRIVNLK